MLDERIKVTAYIQVYKGSHRYQCRLCGNCLRKDEIKDTCPKCGREIKEVVEHG